MVVLKSEEKIMEMHVAVASFKNDENARPPTLLKTVTTTYILIGQVHTFQNSCFKEHT